MSRLLIIDDDKALGRSLEIQLSACGHEACCAATGERGLAILGEWKPDLVLLDLGLPDSSGLDVLKGLLERAPDLPVAMITAQQDMKATIEAMRAGAVDYIRKPFEFDDILLLIEKAASRRPIPARRASDATPPYDAGPNELVGADKKIVEILKQIGLLARSRIPVLIEGESGTGKELVARALHEATDPNAPFVAVNCSAVVPTLLESELFGHEKGAFTDARDRKRGKLELAGAGTMFFDEIGDMPPDLQAKILRALQEREFERVGGVVSIPFAARPVAATNMNLDTLVREGKFRQDLYYRLVVSRLHLPPLRERRADIPLLVHYLLRKIARRLHRNVTGVEEQALRRLEIYDWPGNVRELENVLTRAVALSRHETLTSDDLEFSLSGETDGSGADAEILSLREAERRHVKKALIANDRNITHTAKALKISPTTLRKKITDYDL